MVLLYGLSGVLPVNFIDHQDVHIVVFVIIV